jgi:hypothetical protein
VQPVWGDLKVGLVPVRIDVDGRVAWSRCIGPRGGMGAGGSPWSIWISVCCWRRPTGRIWSGNQLLRGKRSVGYLLALSSAVRSRSGDAIRGKSRGAGGHSSDWSSRVAGKGFGSRRWLGVDWTPVGRALLRIAIRTKGDGRLSVARRVGTAVWVHWWLSRVQLRRERHKDRC